MGVHVDVDSAQCPYVFTTQQEEPAYKFLARIMEVSLAARATVKHILSRASFRRGYDHDVMM